MSRIYDILYDHDIYKDFPLVAYSFDAQGWGGHYEYFKKKIDEVKPELIIEVGTWKGKSAITMADICGADPELRGKTEITCVDTWLGATEFWEDHKDEKRYKSLELCNGYPQVYYQFLANVIITGNQGRITPFPQTSTNAARLLRKKDVQADLIYIDGSHEYEDVLADLEAYWPLLRAGGIMFGDDYCEYWKGVMAAVGDMFYSPLHDLPIEHERWSNEEGQAPSDYWCVRKP